MNVYVSTNSQKKVQKKKKKKKKNQKKKKKKKKKMKNLDFGMSVPLLFFLLKVFFKKFTSSMIRERSY